MTINLKSLKVLVVEDIQPMRELIASVLDSLGFGSIETAESAERGLELTKKLNPDIIICDWMLPNRDGIYFIKDVRMNDTYPNRYVPIILLTAHSEMESVDIARDAGMTEYIIKPFTAAQIAKRIVHVINNPRDFIECSTYFGPDRRRKSSESYAGVERRKADPFKTEK